LSVLLYNTVIVEQTKRFNRNTAIIITALIMIATGLWIVARSSADTTSALPAKPLPFDLPAQSILKSSPKKVFAHYFTPYPISIDNKDPNIDHYTTGYLNPNGENGKHAAYGGFLRERPLPQAPLATTVWELENMKTEVRRATAAGLDGFTVDVLSVTGYSWDRLKVLYQAAPLVDPNFKLMAMPDSTTSDGGDINLLADKMAELAAMSASFKLPDDRFVVSPFAPEALGSAYWQNFINLMTARGVQVAFVPCFLNYRANVAAFAPFSYGFSNWGNRSPATNQDLATNINDAHSRGKIWMQPVSVQDTRPYTAVYDEANNAENLRVTWNAAISYGADWVQIPTWNDYSENTQISPSTHIGWGPLDLVSYYLTRWKTGAWPTILRDTIYVSHRAQPVNATITGGQTIFMKPRSGTSPPRDKVEVLSFLKESGTLQATIGPVSSSVAVPAGVSSNLFNLSPGKVSAVVSRSSIPAVSVDSPWTITTSREIQDLNYYFVTSGRDGLAYTTARRDANRGWRR
jgi:Glycosyl hydrolase family 71